MGQLAQRDERVVLLLRLIGHRAHPHTGAICADLAPLAERTRVEAHPDDRVRCFDGSCSTGGQHVPPLTTDEIVGLYSPAIAALLMGGDEPITPLTTF